ncbi:MAG: PHP domain-containing protein [Myxococcaceae bacterium]
MPIIDLHSHTTASDGEHSPEVLIDLAAQAGVTHLAITDHDTVASLAAARTAAELRGIELVDGIEISAYLENREVHVLGYFVDPASEELRSIQGRFGDERRVRMEQMVAKLQALGFPVHMAQVETVAAGAQLGRPHLARVLMQLGYVTSTQEAFERFLGDGRPAHVENRRITAEGAVALIGRAGGVASIAHPGVTRITKPELERLRAAGLGGLEAIHPEHPPSQQALFLRWTRELDLVPTAGSDFHGQRVSPHRHLGQVSLPEADFTALRARSSRAMRL